MKIFSLILVPAILLAGEKADASSLPDEQDELYQGDILEWGWDKSNRFERLLDSFFEKPLPESREIPLSQSIFESNSAYTELEEASEIPWNPEHDTIFERQYPDYRICLGKIRDTLREGMNIRDPKYHPEEIISKTSGGVSNGEYSPEGAALREYTLTVITDTRENKIVLVNMCKEGYLTLKYQTRVKLDGELYILAEDNPDDPVIRFIRNGLYTDRQEQ